MPNHSNTTDIWNRLEPDGGASHETPVAGCTNYLYVRVKNRGTSAAMDVRVHAYQRRGEGRVWPDDWKPTATQVVHHSYPIAPDGEAVVGPICWTPACGCDDSVIAAVSAECDVANTETIAGTLPTHRLVPNDNNIAQRDMEVREPCDKCGRCGCDCGCSTECSAPTAPPWLPHDTCYYFYEARNQYCNDFQFRVCYEHCLRLVGRLQGPLLYTVTLLPNEKVRLYAYERHRSVKSETQRVSALASLRQSVAVTLQSFTERSVSSYSSRRRRVQDDADHISFGGFLPGFGIDASGPSVSTSSASGTSVTAVASVFARAVRAAASHVQAERSLIVSTYEDEERKATTERLLCNENDCYAVTYYVRQVKEVYEIETRVSCVEILGHDQVWYDISEIDKMPGSQRKLLQECLGRISLPKVGESVRSVRIFLPTDGALYESELAHCSSCEPCREQEKGVEIDLQRAKARQECLEAELLKLEVKRRQKLLEEGNLSPFEPCCPEAETKTEGCD